MKTHLELIPNAPASDELIEALACTVYKVRSHDHPGAAEDFYCQNLLMFMGERMGFVLARLRDAEARIRELEG